MAKHLETIEFVHAANVARSISESAIVAYYMAGPAPDSVKYHYLQMRYELDRLCEIMGLRVVDATDTPQHRMNVASMLQSAAAMIPEE